MISNDLLKKVYFIEWTTKKLVNDASIGQYRSRFKGYGMQFSEHRLYMPGDDVRHIDWKVSARSRDPWVKMYEEERDLTVFLVIDVSGSQKFGTTTCLKSEGVAQIASLLAYAACRAGDRLGLILFADQVEYVIHPQKGKSHFLKIIRNLLTYEPKTRGSQLGVALMAAERMMKHQGIVFIISDFFADHYEVALKRLARKHDVIAFRLYDEKELVPWQAGQWVLQDPETGQECWVNTQSQIFQDWLKQYFLTFEVQMKILFKNYNIENVKISTKEAYAEAVVRFFQKRICRQKSCYF